MEREILFAAINETIENMRDGEKIGLWNEYCDRVNRYDDRIEYMESLPELFDTSSVGGMFNLLNRFYFGHDANDEHSSANPNRAYFYFNGYGNIVTTNYPSDVVDAEELADWIIDNEDALDDDDIQELLDDSAEEEDEEVLAD